VLVYLYRGADKSLAQPGRKQATATDFDVHLSSYNHNWRNISTIYIKQASIERNVITIKKMLGEVGRAMELPAALYHL
jgi:hypothetical protein